MLKKRSAKRKVFLGTDYIINEDAEIIDTKHKYREVNIKERLKYATMYLDDENKYEALRGLGNFGSVWGYVLTYYAKESAIFHFSASVKDDMCKKVGLSMGTIRSAISSFCESGLLLKIRNAEYMVNPHHFYAGHWEVRSEMINRYDDIKESLELKGQQERLNTKTVNL